MKTRAAIQIGNEKTLSICTVNLEEPRDSEVLVKIVACGICHTDVMMQQSNFLLGHEGCGIVKKIGKNVKGFRPNDHVIISYTYCGKCKACKQGVPYKCELLYNPFFLGYRQDGTTPVSINGKAIPTLIRQGSFAEYVVVDEKSLVKVDSNLDLKVLAPLGCGIMTGAGAIINYIKAKIDTSIVIYGLGGVGFGALLTAKKCGCSKIIAIDKIDYRLQLALELGATHVLNSDLSENLVDDILAISSQKGLDYGYDTTGCQTLLNIFPKILKFNAIACGVGGGYINGFNWNIIDEGHAIPQKIIPQMIEWYRNGEFPINKLIQLYPFENVNEALNDIKSGKVIKPVLVMQDI